MIEYVLPLIAFAAIILFIVIFWRQPSEDARRTSEGQTMVYKSDSTDVVAESYYPGIRGSVGPFPIGKREERKKTETFANRENRT